MTNVALIGASGNVGTRLLKELSDRGHNVTAIARHPEKIATIPHVKAVKGDIYNPKELSETLKGHDVVISSVFFSASDPKLLLEAVRSSGVKRYLVVGGAGSLLVPSGQRLVDQPDFPDAYKEEALKGSEFLEILRGVDDIDWTFLSPSAVFFAGERTGVFRLGGDHLLVGKDGSMISFEDFAIAMVDELENPQHTKKRFTVGY